MLIEAAARVAVDIVRITRETGCDGDTYNIFGRSGLVFLVEVDPRQAAQLAVSHGPADGPDEARWEFVQELTEQAGWERGHHTGTPQTGPASRVEVVQPTVEPRAPSRISQPHFALPAVVAAADSAPLRAALDAVWHALNTHGAHCPQFLEEISSTCAEPSQVI